MAVTRDGVWGVDWAEGGCEEVWGGALFVCVWFGGSSGGGRGGGCVCSVQGRVVVCGCLVQGRVVVCGVSVPGQCVVRGLLVVGPGGVCGLSLHVGVMVCVDPVQGLYGVRCH